MKKESLPRLTILTFCIVLGVSANLNGQSSIANIYGALSRVDKDYSSFTFDPNGATVQDTETDYHINGVAYRNGYYYLVRSRPSDSNNQKLLIISETTHEVVQTMTLETSSTHPSGIQIYDNILLVPFTIDGANAKLCFYSLSNPTSPSLIGSYTTALGNAYCAGITEYNGSYLVAHYYSRSGYVRFYRFDNTFNKIAEKTWRATNQDKSDWYPLSDWPDDTYNYESMNLIKTTAGYFIIMYHSSNSVDVYSLNDPGLSSDLDIDMVYRLSCDPYNTGFRYAAGMEITDSENIRFFSTLKHVYSSTGANVISCFNPDTDWPWKLTYNIGTGGQIDAGINDSDNCIEIHFGSPGGASEESLYASVGTINSNTNEVEWGASSNTGGLGTFVAVELANNNYCVEVHQGPSGSLVNNHYYRIGQINASTKTISWGSVINYDTGGQFAIATDNSNHIVEIHRGSVGGSNENKLYYRVGTINTGTKTISWGSSSNYDTGGFLALAMNNNGYCVEIHKGSPGGSNENNLYYRVGSVNFSTKTISWGSSTLFDTGGNIDVSLDDDNKVLEVHRGSSSTSQYNHYYRFGTVNTSAKTISWGSSTKYDVGGELRIAINNNDNGVEVHLGSETGSNSNVHFCRTIECGTGTSLKTAVFDPDYLKIEPAKDFKFYPNPAEKDLNVQLTAKSKGDIVVRIGDISGRVIFNKNIGTYDQGDLVADHLSLNDIIPGIYFISIIESGKCKTTKKLMIK